MDTTIIAAIIIPVIFLVAAGIYWVHMQFIDYQHRIDLLNRSLRYALADAEAARTRLFRISEITAENE